MHTDFQATLIFPGPQNRGTWGLTVLSIVKSLQLSTKKGLTFLPSLRQFVFVQELSVVVRFHALLFVPQALNHPQLPENQLFFDEIIIVADSAISARNVVVLQLLAF